MAGPLGRSIAEASDADAARQSSFDGSLQEVGREERERDRHIDQVLYLEAEAASIRSTGIGCYFDDPVHEVFGISSRDWQSFYHFTVGGPVEDKRLTTLPAYER